MLKVPVVGHGWTARQQTVDTLAGACKPMPRFSQTDGTDMTTTLKELINALRNELEQYGEMLALLDHHQDHGGPTRPDDILLFISSINAQSASIQASRKGREALQTEMARTLNQPSNSSFATLTPLLPEQYRPLISALVTENNELLSRVRRRAEDNHIVLRRSLEMMQRFITTLSPKEGLESYDVPTELTAPPGSAIYQAIA